MDKLDFGLPILVEGKYDKIRLSNLYAGTIICSDGFGIFKNHERVQLIRRLATSQGIIVLTDPDGAGKIIRRYLSGIVPKDKIYHLYVPQIEGKEKRKVQPSKEGFLGVEGMDDSLLYTLLLSFATANGFDQKQGQTLIKKETMTKADFYECGLSGKPHSATLRNQLAMRLALPQGMSSQALLEAVNLLYSKEDILHCLEENNRIN